MAILDAHKKESIVLNRFKESRKKWKKNFYASKHSRILSAPTQ
jgi:hypothetical protein